MDEGRDALPVNKGATLPHAAAKPSWSSRASELLLLLLEAWVSASASSAPSRAVFMLKEGDGGSGLDGVSVSPASDMSRART